MQDCLPIVKDEVVFHGDVIAVIAATTYEAACEAADKIHVRYTPMCRSPMLSRRWHPMPG